MENITEIFESLAALSVAVIAITQFFKVQFNIEKNLLIQIISWVAGIGLSMLAWWQGWGIFEGVSPIVAAVFGLFVGLVDNGIAKAIISIDTSLRKSNVDIMKFFKRDRKTTQ